MNEEKPREGAQAAGEDRPSANVVGEARPNQPVAGQLIEEPQLVELLDFSFVELQILNRRVINRGRLDCS